ncbi:unnamed protein product, partial [Sphacelaria rigidula]
MAEEKTVTMHMRSPNMGTDTVEVEGAGRRYEQVESLFYLGEKISSIGDPHPRWLGVDVLLQVQQSGYVNPYIALLTKVRLLKTGMIEVMLYGSEIWTIAHDIFGALREAHRGFLLRCINERTSSRSAPDNHMLSHHEVLERTSCECVKATVIKRTLLHAARAVRKHDERLPNIVMRGVTVGGKTREGRPARRLQHCITDYCSYFKINATSWTQVAQDVSEWPRVVEKGANAY